MILIFSLILILILIFLYFIYKADNNVISPSDYIINKFKTFENKFEHSEKMLRSIGAKDELINKLKNIRNKTGKNIVYGIKNKDGNYRIEIYLYSKDCTELNYSNADKDKFKKDLNIILNEFGQKMNDNIDKLFNNYNIILISFDLELTDSSFNNKLHLYVMTKEITQYTYTYDIDKNEIELESNFNRVKNYDKLEEVLSNYKLNKNEFINELKEISPNPDSLMFHYKYYNNSIGIYLMENTINHLKKFIQKYNFKNLTLDESCTNLIFDLVVNYDLNQGRINGVGFSDYF